MHDDGRRSLTSRARTIQPDFSSRSRTPVSVAGAGRRCARGPRPHGSVAAEEGEAVQVDVAHLEMARDLLVEERQLEAQLTHVRPHGHREPPLATSRGRGLSDDGSALMCYGSQMSASRELTVHRAVRGDDRRTGRAVAAPTGRAPACGCGGDNEPCPCCCCSTTRRAPSVVVLQALTDEGALVGVGDRPRRRPGRRSSASARRTGRAGCGTTRPAGTRRCWPRACASSGATTCGSATRSCAGASTRSRPSWPRAPTGPVGRTARCRRRSRSACSTSAGPEVPGLRCDELRRQLDGRRGRRRARSAAAAAGRRVDGCADRRRDAARRHAVERRGPRRAADRAARSAAHAAGGRPSSRRWPTRSARRSGSRRSTSTRSRTCCAGCGRRATTWSRRSTWEIKADRPPGHASRCSRTRSCPACSAPTAGRGWTRGSTTAGSAPTTCPAAW